MNCNYCGYDNTPPSQFVIINGEVYWRDVDTEPPENCEGCGESL